jgi:two-component system, cell cycle response regulator
MENKPTILVVDDEQTNIDIVSKILANQYDLRVAYNGTKALTAIEKINIDLLLLDIRMPGLSGFEVAKQIRQEKKYDHIPIIFLSSQNNEESVIEGFDVGGNDYVTKPFNSKELLARIQTHLHVHQLRKFLETMLNLQSTILVLTEHDKLKFINKAGLDFYNFKDSNEFLEHFNCVCETFLEREGYFHHNDLSISWVREILKRPLHERNVIIQPPHGTEKIFQISIQSIPTTSMYVINLIDITESIKNQKNLQEKMNHDPLTGAYNRTYFEQNITSFIEHNKRQGKINAIAFLDIDHFKNINDTYGHNIGDQVLKEFVMLIQNSLRQTDTLIRWGGEEFIIFFALNQYSLIQKICNKLCRLVEDHAFAHVKQITCSIGTTLVNGDETIKEAIERADNALYCAKNSGRNRVILL